MVCVFICMNHNSLNFFFKCKNVGFMLLVPTLRFAFHIYKSYRHFVLPLKFIINIMLMVCAFICMTHKSLKFFVIINKAAINVFANTHSWLSSQDSAWLLGIPAEHYLLPSFWDCFPPDLYHSPGL